MLLPVVSRTPALGSQTDQILQLTPHATMRMLSMHREHVRNLLQLFDMHTAI